MFDEKKYILKAFWKAIRLESSLTSGGTMSQRAGTAAEKAHLGPLRWYSLADKLRNMHDEMGRCNMEEMALSDNQATCHVGL